MRFIIAVILIVILSAVAEYYLPWWTIAVVCFIVSFFAGLRPRMSFLMGFLGIAIFWFGAAMMHDVVNAHILSQKMAVLFHLPNYGLFIGVTVLIGGLVGGLSAWAASLFRTGQTRGSAPGQTHLNSYDN
ncbi:MAG: hypothetical protein ACHQD8_04250 [Chitinophagales bacterium]